MVTGPFAVSGHQREPHPLPRTPTILAGIPGPLTGVIRDTGPLAASWGAEHVIAVHEEALVVLPTLGIHDGDVRDDGDCGARGGVSQGPDLRPPPAPCLTAPYSLDMGRLGWVARLMMASRSGPQPAPLRALTV